MILTGHDNVINIFGSAPLSEIFMDSTDIVDIEEAAVWFSE